MAGDWIKMRTDLADDPAVVTIADAHGLDPDTVVGKLHRLWSWADKHTENGDARVTPMFLERYLNVPGIADTLRKVGWLATTESSISIPNFDRHNGESAKKRCQTAKRMKISRLRKRDATRVTEASPEKRREEKRIHTTTNTTRHVTVASGEFEHEPLPGRWSSVVVELESEGMDFAHDACEAAANNGNTTGEVLAALAHWRKHKPAWGIGVLYNKLRGMRPGLKILWPELPVEVVREQHQANARKVAGATTAKLRTDRQEFAATKERELAEIAELENSHGAELDAMPKKKLRALVEEKFPALAGQVPDRGPVKGLLRQQLLTECFSVAKRPALVS